MGHARLAPSGSHRWTHCPGSVKLEAQYPDSENEHTLRGTAAHWVAEQCLKEGKTPGYWLNQPVTVTKVDGTPIQIVMTQEDVDAVFTYVEYVLLRKKELDTEPGIELEVNPGWWLGERSDISGTADCVLYGPKVIEIVDYKHGSGVLVEPEENTQLLLYAIGACARLNWESKSTEGIIVKMTVVQPRCPSGYGPVRSWEVTMDELLGRLEGLTAAAAATDDVMAPLVFDGTGNDWCRWCRAKVACPEAQQQVMDVFKPVNQSPIQEQDQAYSDWDAIEQNLGRPANLLAPDQLSHIMDKADLIRAWLKAVLEYACEQAEGGVDIPGYKLVPTITRRKWGLDDEEIVSKLSGLKDREGKKIPKADVITVKPLSIAQAEKTIKLRVTDRVWKNVEKLVVKPEGKPTLVPLTDSREPIKTVEEVFQPVQKMPWE